MASLHEWVEGSSTLQHPGAVTKTGLLQNPLKGSNKCLTNMRFARLSPSLVLLVTEPPRIGVR